MTSQAVAVRALRRSLVTRDIFRQALSDACVKLLPQQQWKNPVMFVVYIGSLLTTALWVQALAGHGEAPAGFILAITLWLWFTVLFANFAEAIAEGRSKAQAAALRAVKHDVVAKRLAQPRRDTPVEPVSSAKLRKGDVILAWPRSTRPRSPGNRRR
jgi:K+-transporting ATPase ATPase B chain